MSFITEQSMSILFKEFLISKFNNDNIKIYEELKGIIGIPDYVIVEDFGNMTFTVSFELKLIKWTQAIKQAFKYRAFSNISYVVLNETNINVALNNYDSFKKYNIGLCSFNINSDFKIYHNPVSDYPFSTQSINQLNKIVGNPYHINNFSNFEEILNTNITQRIINNFYSKENTTI